MPAQRPESYTSEALVSAVNELQKFLNVVAKAAEQMHGLGVPGLEIATEAARERAKTDLKRWSRGVTDALDDWMEESKKAKNNLVALGNGSSAEATENKDLGTQTVTGLSRPEKVRNPRSKKT